MIRESMIVILLLLPLDALPAEPAPAATPAVASATPPVTPPVAPAKQAPAALLPGMRFASSVAEEELLAALKLDPAFASLDKELAGSPMALLVTHTLRPTAGGQAAGFLSAVLSGSTLGLIPLVTNDRLVIRYEILLNGKTIASHSFERTATRAQNLWTAGADGYGGLGKAGLEWLKSTAPEAAAKLSRDPAVLAVFDEINFYFPPQAAISKAAEAAQTTGSSRATN